MNVGLLMGLHSNGCVDVDLDTPEAVVLAPTFLPGTDAVFGRSSRPRSHRLYRVEGDVPTRRFQDPDGKTLLELRSTGTQTIVPPSVHPGGERVRWDVDGEPARINGAQLIRAVGRLAAAALLVRHWPEVGARHDTALALAGGLLRAGWQIDEAQQFVLAVAEAAGDEEAQDRLGGVPTTASRLATDTPATGWPRLALLLGKEVMEKVREFLNLPNDQPNLTDRDGLTDTGNADRLVHDHGLDLRYCKEWGKWLVWDGSRWQEDRTGEVDRRAKATVLGIYGEASRASDRGQRASLADHAKRSESLHRLRATVELAKNGETVAATPEQFDTNPYLLNCRNGTIDLRTGELREHRREDLITKLAPVTYDREAEAPTWDGFLETVVPDRETRSYLQRAIGYSLTGDTTEQVMFVLYGSGANGKSTFLETIRSLLGDYALQADSTTLMMKGNDGVRNDIARLVGSRFVSSAEVEDGRRLSEVTVKQLTGGDTITARYLYKEGFEFKPECKFFLAVNHKPQIRGTDNGIWRRVMLVPFTVTVAEEDQDRHLAEKLRAELPGILAWAVRGCGEWQSHRLGLPPAIKEATGEYRAEMDVLGAFLRDCCIERAGVKAKTKDLYAAYTKWCQENGEDILPQRTLGIKLKERGLQNRRGAEGNFVWWGIGLLNSDRHTSEASECSEVVVDKSPMYEKNISTSSKISSPSFTSFTDDDGNEYEGLTF